MKRLINRRQQGDLGEASAIEWLTSVGATVMIPFGHSPHFDLVAEIEGQLLRVQVKTSVCRAKTPDGHERWSVSVVTNGGNQSWTGVSKRFDPRAVEFLFALVGDGRRWFIPSTAIDASTNVTLGGPRYSEFEIDPGRAINDLVYGERPRLESEYPLGEYPSGQRMRSVKPWAYAFAGSNPASPIVASAKPIAPTNYERKLGRSGQAIINQKRRITIPQRAFFEAGLQNGSKVRVRADGPGRIILEQSELPAWARPAHRGPVGEPARTGALSADPDD